MRHDHRGQMPKHHVSHKKRGGQRASRSINQLRDHSIHHPRCRTGDHQRDHPRFHAQSRRRRIRQRRPWKINCRIPRASEDVIRLKKLSMRMRRHRQPPARQHLRLDQVHALVLFLGSQIAPLMNSGKEQIKRGGQCDGERDFPADAARWFTDRIDQRRIDQRRDAPTNRRHSGDGGRQARGCERPADSFARLARRADQREPSEDSKYKHSRDNCRAASVDRGGGGVPQIQSHAAPS